VSRAPDVSVTRAGWLRRLVVAPVIVAFTVVLLVVSPLWLFVALLLSPFAPGWLRPLRLLAIGFLYLVLESVMLLVLLGLWAAAGFGSRVRGPYYQAIHYDLIHLVLYVFVRACQVVFRLEIVTQGQSPDAYPGEPLIVCARHAGPGDSFILVFGLLHRFHREPRVVLKNTIAWDPMIDILLTRVPARFISPKGGPGTDVEEIVGDLAEGLDENDAFVIFPEGGNFTPARRERAIQRLHKLGLDRMAARAEQMTHVLAPRPGGLLAALDAAPDADVLFVAHTGLDHMVTVTDVWRELPMDKRLVMRWWRVPAADIPLDREGRVDWLFGWWERVDEWINEHGPEELPGKRPPRKGVRDEPAVG
jgi:1-acyl-sn-glycerol-3-phosphate acyltransferase